MEINLGYCEKQTSRNTGMQSLSLKNMHDSFARLKQLRTVFILFNKRKEKKEMKIKGIALTKKRIVGFAAIAILFSMVLA